MGGAKARATVLGPVVILASTLFLVTPTAPAQGSTLGNMVCDDGEACVWSDRDFSGCFADLRMPSKDANYVDGNPSWSNCPGNMNDKISSYRNRSQYWFFMYEHIKYEGNKFCGLPGGQSNNLSHLAGGSFGFSPEDRMSSHSYGDGAPPRCSSADNGPRCCEWRDES
jgi:peptidase inhibitor family I36